MLTFGTLIQQYILWLGVRASARRYQQVYRQYFDRPDWRDRPAHSITRHDVLYFRQCYESTPAQCSKGIGLIKQAYQWALDRIDAHTKLPYYEGQNPAWRVTKHDAVSRERLLDCAEIRLILGNLDFLSLKYQAFLVVRLLTPCRITELCTMRRDAVDMNTGKWFKRLTKNGRPQFVLIPRQAMTFLARLPPEGDFFFMGCYGNPLQPESARKVWATFREDLGIPDVQLLDFRRTLASYLYTEIKADELTAKAVLNHYDGRPVAIYTRLNYDRLAAIIQAYADWIWQFSPDGGADERADLYRISRAPLDASLRNCGELLTR